MTETKLYHCTKFESLKAILKDMAFKPSYCLEEAEYLDEKQSFAFAMICFADLMDVEITGHMKKFNSNCYLQMNKEWARKKGLSNVIYYEAHTSSAFAFKEIVNVGVERLQEKDGAKQDKFTIGLSFLMALLKPYKGHYWDKSKNSWSTTETQFYNEREWRYLPIVQRREHSYLDENEFKDETIRKKRLEELTGCPNNLLHFTWDDVEAIGIVEDKRDELISYIFSLDNINHQQVKQKIISL